MDDQRSLRATLSATRKRGSFRPGVMMGGVSGLALVSSIIVYDGFTHAAPSINAIAPEPSSSALIASAPEAISEPISPTADTASAPPAALDASTDVAATHEEAEPNVLAALATPTVDASSYEKPELEVASVAPHTPMAVEIAPANDETAAVAPVLDEPSERDFTAAAPRSPETPAPLKSSDPVALTAMRTETVVAAVAVEPALPPVSSERIDMSVEFEGVEVASALTGPHGVLSTQTPPAVLDAPDLPADIGERNIPNVEVSLSSTDAFGLNPTQQSDFASLVQPVESAPATPDLNLNPAASFSAPLDALMDAPHARTPVLKAPAVVAVLGAQPPVGFISIAPPREVNVISQEDSGRDAARISVMTDDDRAWRRFGVAPRANPENLPVLAIVIDEVGSYGAPIEDVVALSPMVSTSVIPSTPDSALIASTLRASGREVLVHMPMETYADFKEGPRPIRKNMPDDEVRDTARWHLSQFSGYVGVNNHLGSRATRDPRVMNTLMAELSSRGLMFLDSRTSTKSLAEQAALDAGMLATRNHRFIDNDISVGAIMGELSAAAALARRHGAAVALGNPHPATVSAVRRWVELNDGKHVIVAPITHVAEVINAKSEVAVAGK